MQTSLFKALQERFAVRVFAAFTAVIAMTSISYTFFCVRNEQDTLTEAVINKGKLLSEMLAYSSKIGVFSENQRLLESVVEGIFQTQEVLEVSIFNAEGELLTERSRAESLQRPLVAIEGEPKHANDVFQRLKASASSLRLETKDHFEFWAPVTVGSGYSKEEMLILETGESRVERNGQIAGFVRLTMGKEMLKEKSNALLLRATLIAVLFVLIGSFITWVVARRMTRPLHQLIEGVNTLGRGGDVQKLKLERRDELGNLARSFDEMADSLKKREEALRESEQRLRFLSSRLMNAQEEERKRIAKELHDELGQTLALLKNQVKFIQRKLNGNQLDLVGECEETTHLIDSIIEDVRRLSRDLRPLILEDIGLSAALHWLVENFTQRNDVEISLGIDQIDHLFSQEAQTNLYRIFQEALTNIYKHADAKHAHLSLEERNDCALVRVEDDGKGFDVAEVVRRGYLEKGMGLAVMRERAHTLQGVLEINSRVGEGTKILLTVPIENQG